MSRCPSFFFHGLRMMFCGNPLFPYPFSQDFLATAIILLLICHLSLFFPMPSTQGHCGCWGDPGPPISAPSSNRGPDLGTDSKNSALRGPPLALNKSASDLFTQNTDFIKVGTITHNRQVYKNFTHQNGSVLHLIGVCRFPGCMVLFCSDTWLPECTIRFAGRPVPML